MKSFKNLKEMRAYNNKKSKRAHQRLMEDPLRAEAYRIKRRKYEKKRYKKQIEELEEFNNIMR